MKILLINPKRAAGEPLSFPLGLAYIASVLAAEKTAVDVLDLNILNTDPWDALRQKCHRGAYDAYGITGMIINFQEVKTISSRLKQLAPDVPIILGGGLATAIPKIVLSEMGVDICVMGEGEITVVALLKTISQRGDLGIVSGICFKHKGEVICNPPRQEMADIDHLPFPAWGLFPVEAYLKAQRGAGLSMDLITSRGCPYRCAFCFKGIFGDRFRGRGAENVVREVKEIRHRYGIRSFVLRDDTFVMDRSRVIEFCRRLQEEERGLSWSCNGRIDLMDQELLKEMRRAGCRRIAYGIESANPAMLARIKKRISLVDAGKVIRMTLQEGIIPTGYFIIGIPGETKETIEDSIGFCKQTGIVPHFNFLGPMPGTELYEYALRHDYIGDEHDYLLREDWKSMTINMTGLDNEKLILLGSEAAGRIMRHHVRHHPRLMGLIALSEWRDCGFLIFAKKLFRWCCLSAWSPFRWSV